jgi:hypothetical protein
MSHFVAVYDACVLYPAPIRDLLMRLAMSGLFRARWTERIHQEWMQSLARDRPDLSMAQLQRTRELMDETVMDCLVTGYEGLQHGLQLPDEKDRHVLAAAIMCHAGTIVTYNVKDFPSSVLDGYGMTAQHPDQFIEHLLDLSPSAVIKAVKDQRTSLRNPSKTVEELFDTFLERGLATTVSRLREYANLL